MTKKPLTRKSERSKNLLSLICSDGYVYLMKYMFEPFKRFKEFTSEIEKQIGNSIKII
jgi:hypothetical protein